MERFLVELSEAQIEDLQRVLGGTLRVVGNARVRNTPGGTELILPPAKRGAASGPTYLDVTLVEEFDDYLICRPWGRAWDDAAGDVAAKKPRDLRVSSYDGLKLVGADDLVDLADATGQSSRTLTNIADENDVELQKVIPPYVPLQEINGVRYFGSRLRLTRGAADDVVTYSRNGQVVTIEFEDDNHSPTRNWGEDNGS